MHESSSSASFLCFSPHLLQIFFSIKRIHGQSQLPDSHLLNFTIKEERGFPFQIQFEISQSKALIGPAEVLFLLFKPITVTKEMKDYDWSSLAAGDRLLPERKIKNKKGGGGEGGGEKIYSTNPVCLFSSILKQFVSNSQRRVLFTGS